MFLQIHPDNPDTRKIKQAVDILRKGGVIIYPTDTIYGLGCDITNRKAVEKICWLKGIKPKKANFSFICNDLSHLAEYTRPISNSIYKLMKSTLPGPYTYILEASNQVPKLFKNNKKTVGIRVPDNKIAQALVEALGNPIISTSIKNAEEDIIEYPTDPELIYEDFQNQVELVIDGGAGKNLPSTVIDCTSGEALVLREGAGPL